MGELLGVIRSSIIFVLPISRGMADILVSAGFSCGVAVITHGTTGIAILPGLAGVYLVGAVLAHVFGLTTVNWLLRNSVPLLSVALVVLFAPELRRALEQVGRRDRGSGPGGGAA